MAKDREAVPAAVRDAVMKEFNHRCAVCGSDRPHLHHIDEDPSNGAPENLIPLCPNCHLIDQHDATNAVPQGKLLFFRRHKHRNILKPQFNPIYRRLEFLYAIGDSDKVSILEVRSDELVGLVSTLAMGQYFGSAIAKLLKPPSSGMVLTIGDPTSEARARVHRAARDQQYRQQLRDVAPAVETLVVEMLDYQTWESPATSP